MIPIPAMLGAGASALVILNSIKPETRKKVIKGIGIVAGAGVAYYFTNRYIQNLRKDNALSQYGSNTVRGLSVEYASEFYSAFFPSGNEYLSDWIGDGTDEEAIYKLAEKMKANNISISDISREYKTLYDRDFFRDLQKELSSTEMQKFNRLLAGGVGSLPAPLVTTRQTFVYDEWMIPVGEVHANVPLGFSVGTLQSKDQSFTAFEQSGKKFYVKSENVVQP